MSLDILDFPLCFPKERHNRHSILGKNDFYISRACQPTRYKAVMNKAPVTENAVDATVARVPAGRLEFKFPSLFLIGYGMLPLWYGRKNTYLGSSFSSAINYMLDLKRIISFLGTLVSPLTK